MSSRLTVPSIAGLIVGGLLSGTAVLLSGVPDQVLLGGYVVVVFLVSASLTSSAKAGLVLALCTVIAETLADFLWFITAYRADPTLFPYVMGLVIFVWRIPLFPIAGACGGYTGGAYLSESKGKKRKRNVSTGKR